MSELERLRADLEVLERYAEGPRKVYTTKDAVFCVREDIARLEAAADPWREAKEWIEKCRESTTDIKTRRQIAYVDYLTAELVAKEQRIAELEKDPEFTPSILKRADEIVVGDVILAGNRIQTVTEIDSSHSIQRIIKCDGWMAWFYNGDLVAMLPQPLVEAKAVATPQPPSETAWVESELARFIEAGSCEPWPLDRKSREIVRRLAELGTIGDRALMYQLWEDAAKLWDEMKGTGDE